MEKIEDFIRRGSFGGIVPGLVFVIWMLGACFGILTTIKLNELQIGEYFLIGGFALLIFAISAFVFYSLAETLRKQGWRPKK